MELILEEASVIAKLLPRSEAASGCDWRLTKHCLRVPADDGVLLYHTMSGCLLKLDVTEWGAIASDPALRDELARHSFLVPADYDERRLVRDVRYIMRMLRGTEKHITQFTVLTTTGCNARCAYCFEQGTKPVTMRPETAVDVAEYMARSCGGEEIRIEWFGGEPLLNIPAIREICRLLQEKGVRYRSNITSNGYYLDEDISVEAVKDWHVERAQITLDGTKSVYERIKNYVGNPTGAYERVLNNVECALNAGIQVTLRLNADEGNADNLEALIDELAERFRGRDNCRILITQIRSFGHDVECFSTEEAAVRCVVALRKRAASHGLLQMRALQRGMSANHCIADHDGCEVLLPDGNICKCDQVLEGPYLGNVQREEKDELVRGVWKKEMPEYPACEDCPLYPQCIRTEGCGWFSNGCKESVRALRIEDIRTSMLSTYQAWGISKREQ